MSCGASTWATVRIMDSKRFVRDFIRDFKPDSEVIKAIKTPKHVFTYALRGLNDMWIEGPGCAKPNKDDPSAKGYLMSYLGSGGPHPTSWCYDGVTDFFKWCVPYVEAKTAKFHKDVDVWEATAWRISTRFWIDYKMVDGHLVETNPIITEGMDDISDVQEPKVSEIIKCLEKRHPHATREKARYVIRFGAFALESTPNNNQGRRFLDLYDFAEEYEAGDRELVNKLEDDGSYWDLEDDDRPSGRMFYYFEMRFKKSKREGVRDIGFHGDIFDWNRYVVYDEGLTPDDLAAAIAKYVTTKTA